MKTKQLILTALFITLLMNTRSFSEITITFKVDVTGYFIGDGGMHLAGTFASNGSSTITSDWAPGASGSQLTHFSGNVYSIKVNFPQSAVGQQIVFLFVRDSIWGDGYQDFSEGNPGQTFLNLSCGVDDNYGGFNRVFFIPSSDATFSANFDHCGVLTTCPVPANLLTTNITATSAQLNWTAVNAGSNYKIRYRSAGGNWINITEGNIAASSTTISGLTPSTKYQWQIKTNCIFGPSSWTDKISFQTAALKITEDEKGNDFSVNPNPAADYFFVQLKDASQQIQSVQLFDVTGRLVKEVQHGNNEIKIQREELPSGIYFLKVKTGGKELQHKIIFE